MGKWEELIREGWAEPVAKWGNEPVTAGWDELRSEEAADVGWEEVSEDE